MKRKVLSLLLAISLLAQLFSLAIAEGTSNVTLIFPNEEQTIYVGKSRDIKPKLENYNKKTTYSYSSSDTSVATVSKSGTVKGIVAGTTTITCEASTAEGTYIASYKLIVIKGITSISLGKNITMAPSTTYVLTANIMPKDATNRVLNWVSSKEDVATIDVDGVITAHGIGTAQITASTTDGSKKSASLTVEVKEFDIVIRSREGATISKDNYSGKETYELTTGIFIWSYTSKNGCVEKASNSILLPLKPGVDTFTSSVTDYLSRKTKHYKFSVYVTQDALTAPYYLAYQKDENYYLFNVTDQSVLCFSSSDNIVLSGNYSGDLLKSDRYGRSITVQFQNEEGYEEIYFYEEGDDNTIIIEGTNVDKVSYSKIDVLEAERVLNETGYSQIM